MYLCKTSQMPLEMETKKTERSGKTFVDLWERTRMNRERRREEEKEKPVRRES